MNDQPWPQNVLNEAGDVPRGTVSDDFDVHELSYILKKEDRDPNGFLNCDFPTEWPFTIDPEDYSRDSEAAIRMLNTLPYTVIHLKQTTKGLKMMVEDGGSLINRRADGRFENDSGSRDACMGRKIVDRSSPHLRSSHAAYDSLSTDVSTTAAEEICDWISRIRVTVIDVVEVFDNAFIYEHTGEMPWDIEFIDVIPEQAYSQEMVKQYNRYDKELYSIDLEKVVDDIYSTTETVAIELD